MMKQLLIASALLLTLAGGTVLAANPEPFNVQITLRQAISITKVTDLNFGGVDTGAASYTVSAASGAQTGAGTGAAAASFTIVGEAGQTAGVTFGTNPVSITNGTNTISVTLTPQAATHTFTGAAETFYVGGGLTLGGSETTGVYTGTASLSLIYQ